MPTYRSRPPTGRPSWPTILLAGVEKSGKSMCGVQYSADPSVAFMRCIEIGEASLDAYGAYPGARFEIVEHNGTYAGIRDATLSAVAEPAVVDGRIVPVMFDSISRLWELLSDEAQEMANRRAAVKAAKSGGKAGDEEDIGTDLWNRAKDRWYVVLDALRMYPGPVILTARFEEQVKFEGGRPSRTGAREWKILGQKRLPFDVDVIVQMRRRGDFTLTGIRSLTLQIEDGQSMPMPGFTIAGLLEQMNVNLETVTDRIHVPLDARAIDPEPAAEPLPDDFDTLLANLENKADWDGMRRLGFRAKGLGEANAVAAVDAAWRRAVAAVKASAAVEVQAEPPTAKRTRGSRPARMPADVAEGAGG